MATISLTPPAPLVRSLVFKTAEHYLGQPLYFVSLWGLADLRGAGVGKKGPDWQEHLLRVQLEIPIDRMQLPDQPQDGYYLPEFRAKYWTVYAGLNQISNQGASYYSGYAVNGFRLKGTPVLAPTVTLEADVAVRDNDGYVEEVGFQLELLLSCIGYRKIATTR